MCVKAVRHWNPAKSKAQPQIAGCWLGNSFRPWLLNWSHISLVSYRDWDGMEWKESRENWDIWKLIIIITIIIYLQQINDQANLLAGYLSELFIAITTAWITVRKHLLFLELFMEWYILWKCESEYWLREDWMLENYDYFVA